MKAAGLHLERSPEETGGFGKRPLRTKKLSLSSWILSRPFLARASTHPATRIFEKSSLPSHNWPSVPVAPFSSYATSIRVPPRKPSTVVLDQSASSTRLVLVSSLPST